jgi:hypothetical protein
MEKNNSNVAQSAASPSIDFSRSESFRNEYSNNSLLQSSARDLKILFGELDQTKGPNTVLQHTGITLSWPQAKVMSYYLQIHLAIHELEYGRTTLPKGVIVDVPEPSPEMIKQYPQALEVYEAVLKLHDAFLASNPEAASS